jgi:hypothetical protein
LYHQKEKNMEVKFKDRSDLEDWLIADDFDTIAADIDGTNGSSFLRDILYSGWKGVCQMTDEELIEEFNCRTDEIAIILTDGNGDVNLTVVK